MGLSCLQEDSVKAELVGTSWCCGELLVGEPGLGSPTSVVHSLSVRGVDKRHRATDVLAPEED